MSTDVGIQIVAGDPNWTRGVSDAKDGMVILRKPEPYLIAAIDGEAIVFDFARIHTPREAAAFAGKYGLLRHHGAGREPYVAWDKDAVTFRVLMSLYLYLPRAVE